MFLNVEAILGIAALVVALPPSALVIYRWKYYPRKKDDMITPEEALPTSSIRLRSPEPAHMLGRHQHSASAGSLTAESLEPPPQ